MTYVATAMREPGDEEMASRIARHQAGRPQDWTTLEVPRDLEEALVPLMSREGAVVIDCVTLWLSNLMLGVAGRSLEDAEILDAVVRAVRAGRGKPRVVWVSNEVGSGIVPANALARRFADLQGMANQRLAAECDTVHFCVAGLSIRIK